MKTPLRTLVSQKKKALKSAHPKSRDRIRHELNVLLKAMVMTKRCRAA
jgi:hypothetical protein